MSVNTSRAFETEGKACAKALGQENTRYVQEQQEGPVATGDSLEHDLREVTEGDRKPFQA